MKKLFAVLSLAIIIAVISGCGGNKISGIESDQSIIQHNTSTVNESTDTEQTINDVQNTLDDLDDTVNALDEIEDSDIQIP